MRISRSTTAYGVVIAGYILAALCMTLPLGWQFTDFVAGTGGDPWQTMWRFEHTATQIREAVQSGQLGTFVRHELGSGEPRLVNLSAWPWLWLHGLVGQPVAYNLIWFLSFVLSGLAMYSLVRWLLTQPAAEATPSVETTWVREWGAPFLAGLWYMFTPFHVAHSMGHFGAMQGQWLPLLILLFLRYMKRPNVTTAALLAAVFVIQAWTEHHYALWFAIFVGLYAAWQWPQVRTHWQQPAAVRSAAVIGLVILAGVIGPYRPTLAFLQQPGSASVIELGVDQTVRFSSDVLTYFTPQQWHPVWGGAAWHFVAQHFTGNVSEATAYVGLTALLLIIFFHQPIPRAQKYWWFFVASVFFVIALGPKLHIFGRILPLPLPYALIDDLPPFSAVRTVARANIMVMVSVGILLGWVVAAQFKRRGAALAVGGLIILEFLFLPVPMQSARLAAAYPAVADLSGDAIVEIPAATNYAIASRALWASLIHGKEVVGNIALERASGGTESKEVRSLPGLRHLLFLRTTPLLENEPDFFGQQLAETLPDVLTYLDARAIVVHPDSLTSIQTQAVREALQNEMGLVPRQFDDVLLYELVPEDYATDGVFLARDDNWHGVGQDSVTNQPIATVYERATVTLYNVTAQPKNIILSFALAPGSVQGFGLYDENNNLLVQSTQEDVISAQLDIPPGTATITFRPQVPGNLIILNPQITVNEP